MLSQELSHTFNPQLSRAGLSPLWLCMFVTPDAAVSAHLFKIFLFILFLLFIVFSVLGMTFDV